VDPYTILEIAKDASEKEIKKAYRKKATKYHPDHGGDEEKFKQINEAYSILSDENKKAQYDAMRDGVNLNIGDFVRNFASGFGGFGGFDPFGFTEIFSGKQKRRKKEIKETQDQEITFELKISAADIKRGIQKIGTYKRYIKCVPCKSEGGKNKNICLECHGTGMKTMQMTPNIIQHISCQTCNGTGSTFTEYCKSCNGVGFVQSSERIKFEIKQID